MRWRLICLLVTLGALLLSSGPRSWGGEEENTHQTFSLPPDPRFFQPGAGQEIANTYCLICHSSDYVYTQPLLSQEKWQSLIVKMKHAFGCPIPDDQISFLAAYLFGQNSATLTSSESYP